MNATSDRDHAGAGGGPGNGTPAIDVDRFRIAWYIIEKSAKVVPTYTIEIKARLSIRITVEDEEIEIEPNGITLKSGDDELVIDPRYNTAVLRKRGKTTVSNKVKYGTIYEVKTFAELVKKSVKELIEETASSVFF